MSTRRDAQPAPRTLRRSARRGAVSPLLGALGRALIFLAWAALLAWAILARPSRAGAEEAPDAAIVTSLPVRL